MRHTGGRVSWGEGAGESGGTFYCLREYPGFLLWFYGAFERRPGEAGFAGGGAAVGRPAVPVPGGRGPLLFRFPADHDPGYGECAYFVKKTPGNQKDTF